MNPARRIEISKRVEMAVTSKWHAMEGIRDLLKELRPDDQVQDLDLEDGETELALQE